MQTSYTRVSVDYFNKMCSKGKWTMERPIAPWNGMAAYTIVSYKTKTGPKEAKIIINNYYVTN